MVRIAPVQEKRDEVLDILLSMKGPTQAESGCLACWILEEFGEDAAIVYVEQWRSSAEMHRHMRTPLYARILQAMELSRTEPQVCFFEVVESSGLELVEQARTNNRKQS